MTYFNQVKEARRTALHGMFNARSKEERAMYMNLYRWACEEIRRHYTAGTVSA